MTTNVDLEKLQKDAVDLQSGLRLFRIRHLCNQGEF